MTESAMPRWRRRRSASVVAAVLLAAVGVTLIGAALAGQEAAPTTPGIPALAAGRADGSVGQAVLAGQAASSARPAVLAGSRPLSLEIPVIGVATSLVELGLTTDGALQVPSDVALAGWYGLGPTPGERGPAVIAGHVDSAADGPAVFFRLAELAAGDEVEVSRVDGQVAIFSVTRVEQYPKDAFPTEKVYGNTQGAALRLITCGGGFDGDTGHYRDNVVAHADLIGVRGAAAP